jgi:hypothetical protein
MTRSLRSAGITPLQRYYEAVRPWPAHRYFRVAVAKPVSIRCFVRGPVMNDISDSSRGVATRANTNQRRVFRVPLVPRVLSLFGVIFLVGITAIMIGFAAIAFTMQWAFGLFMLACAGFMAALTGYVGRDLRGKWGLRVILDSDAVTLDLPAGRSLIHRPPAQHLTIPYTDSEAIDARFEAYGTLGMEMMQRAYVLHRKGGELIFLFEERALATTL